MANFNTDEKNDNLVLAKEIKINSLENEFKNKRTIETATKLISELDYYKKMERGLPYSKIRMGTRKN